MCLVLRRWITWWPAAFVGGLIYGLSGYVASNVSGLLFLTFVPLPPVIFLLLHEIFVRQQWRPGRTGIVLGAVCAIQFFIWPEILASTVVMGMIAIVLVLLARRHDLVRRWRYAARAFAYTVGTGLVLLVVPLWYSLLGPQSISGTPVSPSSWTAFPTDLLGVVVPSTQRLGTEHLTAIADHRFPFATILYLGLPLLIALALFAVFLRKRRAILFAGTMALIALFLSLGPRLWVDGHETSVRLPFLILGQLPVAKGFAPGRFSLYTALFAAGMFAIGLDELRRRMRESTRPRWLSPRWRIIAAAATAAVIAAAVLIPLVPGNARPTTPTGVPSFFTSTAVDAIPPGSVVLAYPYPDLSGPSLFFQTTHDMMLDQAVAGMRFKLIGGYGWIPSPTGPHGTLAPTTLQPRSVQEMFDSAYYGTAPAQGASLPARTAAAHLRAFLRRYGVGTVIALPEGANPAAVVSGVTAAIGPPVESGGVTVWFHVEHRLLVNQIHIPPGGIGGIHQPFVTEVLKPANGATLTGSEVLDAKATDDVKVTDVEFHLTGQSLHDTLIGTGAQTIDGWITRWNTTTVPNGTYVLRSVASDTSGKSTQSAGVTVRVKN
jgi:hypothetical protein